MGANTHPHPQLTGSEILSNLKLELRYNRMKWWALLTAAASIVMALTEIHRWGVSFAEASIWWELPLIYFGPILTIGAALSENRWRKTSFANLRRASGRPAWQTIGTHYLVSILYATIVPTVLPAAVIFSIASMGEGRGTISYFHFLFYPLFPALLCILGIVIGSTLQSYYGTLFTALAFGIIFTSFTNPAPPSNHAWMTTNPTQVLLIVALLLLLVLAAFVSASEHIGRWHKPRMATAFALATCTVVLAWLTAGNVPYQVEATRDTPGPCHPVGEGQICVWPGDEYYFASLEPLASRYLAVSEEWGLPTTVTFSEPGLPSTGAALTISPRGLGDGMWMTAEEMAFSIIGQASTGELCEFPTPEEQEAWMHKNWVITEMMADHLYGQARPDTVGSNNPGDADIKEKAAAAMALPENERVAHMKSLIEEVDACTP